jgi:hypothetical protein
MDLQAELFLTVEPFDQDGEGIFGWPTLAHNTFGVCTDELAYGLAVTGRGLSLAAVDDLPALADDFAFRQFAV